MVELADTQDLGSCADGMQVRPLLPAPVEKVLKHKGFEAFLFLYTSLKIKNVLFAFVKPSIDNTSQVIKRTGLLILIYDSLLSK